MSKLATLLPRLRESLLWAALPGTVWGTKGFEFWTFLSLLLVHAKSSRLLELGSGRSTLTLAEYTKFRKAELISIESSEKWFNKMAIDLQTVGLTRNPVQLVKIDSAVAWYEPKKFRSLIGDKRDFDFIFVDGPNEPGGHSMGLRNSEAAVREISACAAHAHLMVVDDVHRRHVFETVDRCLVEPAQYEKWYYDYAVHHKYDNSICICARKGSAGALAISAIQGMLGIPLYREFDSSQCPED